MKAKYQESAGAPDLTELSADFRDCVERRDSSIFRRQRLNYQTRYCIWPHQSNDGKKWSAPAGENPFPWKGASDVRFPLIDKYINEDVSRLMVTWTRMRIIASGTESGDAALSVRMTQVLRWCKYTQMTEARREMRLAANYMLERGAAVVGVFWDKRFQLGNDEIDLETIKAAGMQAQEEATQGNRAITEMEQALINFPQMVLDPSQEAEAARLFGMQYPDVKPARLRKVIQDLRKTGHAKFPRPYEVRNRPTVVALAPNEDIFLPPETTDLQEARVIYRRELLTETKLRERIVSHEWDADWVEEMIATQRGKITADFDGNVFRQVSRVNSSGVQNTDKLFEILHAYRKLADDDGVPGIYYTCFSPGIPDSWAYHELLNYDHGEYPFVYFAREARSRLLDDTRGYGEIASTWQNQIKGEWDSRIDRASIATLPPSYYPAGEAPDKWGPGVQIPTSRPDDYGFMQVPKYDPGSREVELSVRDFSDEYFGRPTNEKNQLQSQITQQDQADEWMSGCARVDTQTMQLMQQFMKDEFFYRVVGEGKGKPIRSTREEIQGKFDISISYNTQDMDTEFVSKKIDLLEKALSMDTTGRIDRDEALTVTFELIDPNMGERLLKPGEEASQQELDDEAGAYAKIFAGLPVDIRPGQAYQLRLQWLQNMLSNNATAQARYKNDPQFKENLDKRLQQLSFQLQQRQNAIIGRLGA